MSLSYSRDKREYNKGLRHQDSDEEEGEEASESEEQLSEGTGEEPEEEPEQSEVLDEEAEMMKAMGLPLSFGQDRPLSIGQDKPKQSKVGRSYKMSNLRTWSTYGGCMY